MEITFTQAGLLNTAKKILDRVPTNILAFQGPMGAGKTTLIKAMLTVLGAQDAGSSPTFGIVNEYHGRDGELLAFHFDFYRLENETEALDLGFEEYLERGVWIFMEWPEKIPGLLPEETTPVVLEIVTAGTRKVII